MIVGGSFMDPSHARAFMWDSSNGMRDLQEVLEKDYGLALPGWTLLAAFDVTPDGSVITGYGRNPAGNEEAFRISLPSSTIQERIDR